MIYIFECPICNKDWDLDIPMKDYDLQKEKQYCPWCKSKLFRKIEWTGVAEGKGSGWYGKSNGSKVI